MAESVTQRRGRKQEVARERVHSSSEPASAAAPPAAQTRLVSEPESELWFGLPEWPTMHFLWLVLGIITRYYRLADPAAVVFDEHHFGRFTNQYTKGTYLFDIHPPLGKLVFWLVAWIVGYDPDACDYSTIHTKYTEGCNYMPLRIVAAAFGCLTVPLIYSICRRFGCRVVSSSLAALLFLTDNLNLIESRLILVDSQLIFFAALALWVALVYWERRRQHEDALLLLGRADIRPLAGGARDVARTGNSVVDADDVINRGYGSLGVWVPPPFAFLARPGRATLEDDAMEMTERQNPVAVEAAAHGIGRMRSRRSERPRLLSLSERLLWAVGLGLVCGCAVSIKWTNLATPGMIAIETFFGLFFLREPAALEDLLTMGGSALGIYTLWFYIHFALLPVSGDGDGFMRLEFQKTLPGNTNYDANARKPFFLTTFVQLNQEMLSANSRIDTPHHWMSKWWTWPINSRGVLYYSSDVEDGKQQLIYLLGNPAAIWLVLAGVCCGFGVLFMYCRCRSGHDAFFPNWVRAFASTLTYTCIIWLLNLLPYILVSRAAFVYHYMPALLYAELATAIVVDKLSGKHLNTVAMVLGGLVLAVWLMFTPWVYGIPVSKDYHASLRWMKGWD